MAHCFANLLANKDPVHLYLYDRDKEKLEKVRQVLWGDWLKIDDNPDRIAISGWLPILWAPNTKKEKLYIREEHTTHIRPLEIIFLDVGQGDGAVVITPEQGQGEKIVVIDAGQNGNMKAFLDGRFKAYRGFDFEAAVITHPDQDHYLGFREIFQEHAIGFRTIYQSGLVERPVNGTFAKLGGVTRDSESGNYYIENLAVNRADIEKHFSDDSDFGRKVFPPLMHSALNNPKIGDIRMLSVDPTHSVHHNGKAYMPGFEPSDETKYSIEVLGPVVEYDAAGKPRLRRISSNYGETKNGHSVILKLHYGKFNVLFGGDLNVPAEKYLLQHYSNMDSFPSPGDEGYAEMLIKASARFNADIMKVCHHGSSKVTDEFMQVVNPACFVISSGDQEGHVHPRPDLLGRLGKFGRGKSPVILSTELQRSTREFEDKELVDGLTTDIDKLAADPSNNDLTSSIKDRIITLARSNVDVYGAIYLKTDGERLITAFKIEEKSDLKKWFYYEYIIDNSGRLELRT